MNVRSKFLTTMVTQDVVYLEDRDGAVSMTNDAEAVCQWCQDNYPGKRVVYRDTMGRWDEMEHEEGAFARFRPWEGMVPA